MGNEIVYELRNISFAYSGRFPALERVDLAIGRGEKTALLGANGSGKSTLLLILAGLVFPSEGSIKFMNQDMGEGSFAAAPFRKFFRSRTGIVFQNSDTQLFNSSVADEVMFGLVQLKLSRKEIEERISGYMALMAIERLKDRHPQDLSIGEKKRVAIASVLAMEPEVILMDEPTAGLDPRTARHLIDAIQMFSEKGATIITATQDIHIVSEIADRVVVLGEDKRKVRDGRAEEILKDTAFLEEHNLIHMHAHKHEDTTHVHPHEHPDHHHSHPIS